MNQELKTKWVEALRSGKYPQGKRYLNRDGAYCCLGVLCEVRGEEKRTSSEYGATSYGESNDPRTSTLSPEMLESAGMDCYSQQTLVNLNDADNKSFSEIADWIEANL